MTDVPALTSLCRLNSFLDNVDCGEIIVRGDLDAFSCEYWPRILAPAGSIFSAFPQTHGRMQEAFLDPILAHPCVAGKLAGLDKKLSRSLEEDFIESSSPADLGASPVGPLADAGSRRTLVYLILTLNHIYPDYDFTLLRAHHFRKEEGVPAVEEAVDARLVEVGKVWEATPGYGEGPFLDCLWAAIDEVADLKECDVYSYQSDLENDPFGEKGSVWSFNYFFHNRKSKRILYFSCRGLAKSAVELSVTTEYKYNEDADAEDTTEGEAPADDGGDEVATSMANEMDL
jgi:hypothetical protein